MVERREILVSGFGGQGVVLLGRTLGTAAVGQDLHASMLISHGTETRGGYVRSQVVIAGEAIDDPAVERPDLFLALSQAAYDRFIHLAHAGTWVVYESGRVKPADDRSANHIPIAAEELARTRFGKPVFASAILLGTAVRLLDGLLTPALIADILADRLPAHAAANRAAFTLGLEGAP